MGGGEGGIGGVVALISLVYCLVCISGIVLPCTAQVALGFALLWPSFYHVDDFSGRNLPGGSARPAPARRRRASSGRFFLFGCGVC